MAFLIFIQFVNTVVYIDHIKPSTSITITVDLPWRQAAGSRLYTLPLDAGNS